MSAPSAAAAAATADVKEPEVATISIWFCPSRDVEIELERVPVDDLYSWDATRFCEKFNLAFYNMSVKNADDDPRPIQDFRSEFDKANPDSPGSVDEDTLKNIISMNGSGLLRVHVFHSRIVKPAPKSLQSKLTRNVVAADEHKPTQPSEANNSLTPAKKSKSNAPKYEPLKTEYSSFFLGQSFLATVANKGATIFGVKIVSAFFPEAFWKARGISENVKKSTLSSSATSSSQPDAKTSAAAQQEEKDDSAARLKGTYSCKSYKDSPSEDNFFLIADVKTTRDGYSTTKFGSAQFEARVRMDEGTRDELKSRLITEFEMSPARAPEDHLSLPMSFTDRYYANKTNNEVVKTDCVYFKVFAKEETQTSDIVLPVGGYPCRELAKRTAQPADDRVNGPYLYSDFRYMYLLYKPYYKHFFKPADSSLTKAPGTVANNCEKIPLSKLKNRIASSMKVWDVYKMLEVQSKKPTSDEDKLSPNYIAMNIVRANADMLYRSETRFLVECHLTSVMPNNDAANMCINRVYPLCSLGELDDPDTADEFAALKASSFFEKL